MNLFAHIVHFCTFVIHKCKLTQMTVLRSRNKNKTLLDKFNLDLNEEKISCNLKSALQVTLNCYMFAENNVLIKSKGDYKMKTLIN